MAKSPAPTSPTTLTGNGGETHQRGGGLTTNFGVPESVFGKFPKTPVIMPD